MGYSETKRFVFRSSRTLCVQDFLGFHLRLRSLGFALVLATWGLAACKYKSDRVKPAGDLDPFHRIYKDTRSTDRRPSCSTSSDALMNKNIPHSGAPYRLDWSSANDPFRANITFIVDLLLCRLGLDSSRVLSLGYARTFLGQD